MSGAPGHSPGGNIPYGYRRERKTLVLNELEAVVVRTILEASRGGSVVPEIVELLNRQGYKRRNGTPWTRRQVQAILSRRELYVEGKFRYGKVEGMNEQFILDD